MAAKYITWYPPLDKVTGVMPTLAAGGSLAPDTTYYIRVYAVNTNTWQANWRHGEISDEVSITTDSSNLTINLAWNAVTDAGAYAVLMTTTSGNYSGTNKLLNGTGSGSSGYSTNTNSLVITTTSGYYNQHKFILSKELPFGFDKSKGLGRLEFYGGDASDPITLQDIYTAIGDTNNCYYDGVNFGLNGILYQTGTAYFLSEYENVFTLGLLQASAAGGNVQFGNANDNTSRRGSLRFLAARGVDLELRNNTWKFYGTEIKAADEYYNIAAAQIDSISVYTDGATFVNTRLLCGLKVYDFDYTGSVGFLAFNSSGNYTKLQNVYVDNRVTGAYYTVDMLFRSMTLRNIRVYTGTNYYYGFRCSNNLLNTVVNLTVDDVADNVPSVLWYGGGDPTGDTGLRLQNTLDVEVLDGNGLPINGATVTVKDALGEQEFSVTTGVDGKIIQQDVNYVLLKAGSSSYDAPTVRTDKTPHTLSVVTDAGSYETLVSMDRARDIVVTIQPSGGISRSRLLGGI